MYNQWNNYPSFYTQSQPMYTPQYLPMFTPQSQPMYTPQSQPMFTPRGYLGLNDIQFIKANNLPYNTDTLLKEMNSSEIGDVNAHRTIQEKLYKNYGYKSDQKAWNKNCYIMHNYELAKYKK